MSAEAYAAERDGILLSTRKEVNVAAQARIQNKTETQKILDKARRLLTAIDLEVSDMNGEFKTTAIISNWAQEIIDDLTIFIDIGAE